MFDAIKMWFIEREVKKMLERIKELTDGWKTHAVQVLAILIALSAMIWGPYEVGNLRIPQMDFKDFLEILQVGGGLSFLRLAVKKKKDKIEEAKV